MYWKSIHVPRAPFLLFPKQRVIHVAKIAAKCMIGQTLQQQAATEERIPEYYSVKEAVFPFIKFSRCGYFTRPGNEIHW